MVRLGKLYLLSFAMTIKIKCGVLNRMLKEKKDIRLKK